MNKSNQHTLLQGSFFTLLLIAANAQAATYKVSNTNDSGAGSLRDAIAKANASAGTDIIEFAVTPANQTIRLNSEMSITDALTINGKKITIDAGNKSRIFKVTKPLTIKNMTLKNGAVTGFDSGGAINTTAKLTILNSTLSGNKTARGRGGAIFTTADVTINGSTLSGNESTGSSGGAIYAYAFNRNANIVVTNSMLSGNKAGLLHGGAIYTLANGNANANVTISKSTLSNNRAVKDAGAIYTYAYNADANANINIDNSTLSNNKAVNGNAGAIYAFADASSGKNGNINANISIKNSKLSGNKAQKGSGGGIYARAKTGFRANNNVNVNANVTINESILSNHTKVQHGGAIMASSFALRGNANANVKINKSMLSGNKAKPLNGGFGDGGAVFVQSEVGSRNHNKGKASSDLVISGSTLANNSSNGKGGAIFTRALDNAKVNVTIENSTLSGNKAAQKGGALFAFKRQNSKSKISLNGSIFVGNQSAVRNEKNCKLAGSSNIANTSANNMLDEGCGQMDTSKNTINKNLKLKDIIAQLPNSKCTVFAGNPPECVKTVTLKFPELKITPTAYGTVNSSTKAKVGAIESCNNINKSKCSATYDRDTQVTLSATPTNGYFFDKWTGDCKGTASKLKITMNKSKTCQATFTKKAIVKGACGTANDEPTLLEPSTNLCTTGNASSVTSSDKTFAWSCQGTEVSCSAPRQYRLSYAGGGKLPVNAIVTVGTEVTLKTPTRDGFTFAGWNSNKNGSGTSYAAGASFTMPSGNRVLYAQWTANGNTVTFDLKGHGTAINSQTVTTGNKAKQPTPPPTAAGFTFGGWFTDAATTTAYDFTTVVNGDVTLYAKWTKSPVRSKVFTTPSGAVELTLSGGGQTCEFQSTTYYQKAQDLSGSPKAPDGLTFKQGLVGFVAERCDKGSTITITIAYPNTITSGAKLTKWGRTASNKTNHWYDHSADINGNTVTYTVTDGGKGDDDLTANGKIVDPVGVGSRASVPPTARPVPSLGMVALLSMAFLLALMAGFGMRYRRI